MQIYVYSGHHSNELFEGLKKSWSENHLFILCPPKLDHFNWIRVLPKGKIHILGDFSSHAIAEILKEQKVLNECDEQIVYPDVPVLGVFTSGTVSGSPRLSLYSKNNVEKSLEGILTFFNPAKITDIFCYPQAFHTFGLTLGYIHSIIYNRKLWFSEGRYSTLAHELRSSLDMETLLTLGTPTHFHDLAAYLKEHNKTLAPSYSCIMGGAKVSVAQWFNVRDELKIESPSIGYGATEACPGITHHPAGHVPKEDGEIGYPLPHLRIRVIPGEGLEFSGESLCLAIIEDQTIVFPKRVIIRDDIHIRASDEMYIFKNRSELVLNRGGTKYYLEHLESVIEAEIGLRVVGVVVPDERLGEDLGLLLVTDHLAEFEILKKKIQDFLKVKYAYFFDLKFCLTIPKLPVTSNGKIDRNQALMLLIHQN